MISGPDLVCPLQLQDRPLNLAQGIFGQAIHEHDLLRQLESGHALACALAIKADCVCKAPLGTPVVPEV